MANLLATEPSAYLQSAAHQPVHWHPWGGAAFDTARTLDKPILLDIGAVWCHWCHVMDGESYEDPDIAKLLNEEFVCIKVDRDERPDVDARYRPASLRTPRTTWPASSTSGTAASARRPNSLTPPPASFSWAAGTTRARTGSATWSRRPSPRWRAGGSATTWAGGSTATPWTSAGSCRTSRRWPTTTPSCCTPT